MGVVLLELIPNDPLVYNVENETLKPKIPTYFRYFAVEIISVKINPGIEGRYQGHTDDTKTGYSPHFEEHPEVRIEPVV